MFLRSMTAGAFMLAALGGCGVHIHRPADLALAQKAQTTFQEAKLAESLAEERKASEELVKREAAAARRQAKATRDTHLVAIVANQGGGDKGSWTRLDSEVNGRLVKIIGPSPEPQIRQLLETLVAEEIEEKSLVRRRALYRMAAAPGDPPLVCSSAPGAAVDPSKVTSAARTFAISYAEHCKELLALERKIGADFGAADSAWVALMRDIRRAEMARDEIVEEVKKGKEKYDAAKEAYDKATKSGTPLAEAANTLTAALKQLGKLPSKEQIEDFDKVLDRRGLKGFQLEGAIAQLTEQRQSLLKLIDAIRAAGGAAQPPATGETKTNLAIASTLTALAGVTAANRTPDIQVLLLESEHLRLDLERLTRQKSRAATKLGLLKDKRAALEQELYALRTARLSLDELLVRPSPEPTQPEQPVCLTPVAGELPIWKRINTSLSDSFKGFNSRCRALTGEALLALADSWTVGRVVQEEIDYRLIGLDHDAALDASEVALAQWQNLIGVPLDGLVALHGSGIKPETIANLLGAVGVTGAIGAR